MKFTVPKLFDDRPPKHDRRDVVKFAWFPVRTPYVFGDSKSFIWLERYQAHQFYSEWLGGSWVTQYTSRIEK